MCGSGRKGVPTYMCIVKLYYDDDDDIDDYGEMFFTEANNLVG